MPAGTYDDLQKRIDEWTQDMLNDDKKMQVWAEGNKSLSEYRKEPAWQERYSEWGDKENALDELFGVK